MGVPRGPQLPSGLSELSHALPSSGAPGATGGIAGLEAWVSRGPSCAIPGEAAKGRGWPSSYTGTSAALTWHLRPRTAGHQLDSAGQTSLRVQ